MNIIAPIGDNLRDPLDSELAEALQEFRDAFDARGGEIERAKVTNDDEAGRATALAAILLDIVSDADRKRVAIKEPYLKASRKIDGTFGGFIEAVKLAKNNIVAMVDRYRHEQRRKADEERVRLEKEARDKEAAAQAAAANGNALQAARLAKQAEESIERAQVVAAPAAPIRSSYGQTASGRTEWKHEIVDRKKLPAPIINHPKVVEAINGVIASMLRSGTREIPGVRIYAEQKTVIRR